MNNFEQYLTIKKNRIFVLIAIIIVGLLMRVYRLDSHGAWCDEKISVSHAIGATKVFHEFSKNPKKSYKPDDFWNQNNLSAVTWGVTNLSGGNALLYAYCLHYWIKIFGPTDFSIRFMSVFFSLLSVLAFYKLAKALWDNYSFAMINAFLISSSYLSIQYSHEARTYSLTIFLTILSTLLLVKFLQTDENKEKVLFIGLYLISIVLSFFGHFLIVSVLFGQGLLFLVMGAKKIPNYIYLIACYALFAGISLYYFQETDCLNKLSSNGNKWTIAAQDPANNIDASLKNIVSEYFQMSLHLLANGLNYTGIRVRYLIPLLVLPVALVFFASKQKKMPILVLGIGMSLAQLAFSTVLAVKAGHTISFVPKYAVFNQPYMFLVFSLGILYIFHHTFKHLIMKGIIGFIVVVNIISIYPVYLDNIVFVATDFIRDKNGYILNANKIKEYPEEKTKIIVPSVGYALCHSFYLQDYDYEFIIDNENKDVTVISGEGKKETIFKDIESENY